jgi:FkbM family methyltransferase
MLLTDTVVDVRRSLNDTGEWHGIFGRPGDATIIREIILDNEYHALPIHESDRVLDLGAHVGVVARWVLEKGAAHVVSVEPHPETLKYLHRNVQGLPVDVWEGAVVRNQRPVVLSMTRQHASASITHNSNATQHYSVRAIEFRELFENNDYDVMKMDIEGSEYEILLPYPLELETSSITRMFVELHRKTPYYHEKGLKLKEELENNGWRVTYSRAWQEVQTHTWPVQMVWER